MEKQPTQANLFDVPTMKKMAPPPNMRCRNCIHIRTHQWNSSWKYCEKQKSTRTGSGMKKIGAMDRACELFEPIKPEKVQSGYEELKIEDNLPF